MLLKGRLNGGYDISGTFLLITESKVKLSCAVHVYEHVLFPEEGYNPYNAY